MLSDNGEISRELSGKIRKEVRAVQGQTRRTSWIDLLERKDGSE